MPNAPDDLHRPHITLCHLSVTPEIPKIPILASSKDFEGELIDQSSSGAPGPASIQRKRNGGATCRHNLLHM